MHNRFRCLACFVIALSLPVAGEARAGDGSTAATQGDERARTLYLRGDKAYAEGDYEAALAAFERAYALSGRHALLYNMANAHERLGEYDKALDKLRRFLPHASASQQALLEKRMRNLQMRIDEERAEGQEASRKSRQKPKPESESQSQSEPKDTEGKGAPDGTSVESRAVSTPPYAGYALIGVGALGLGLGTYFGTQAWSARSEAQDACPDVNGARRCTTDARDAIDRDRTRSLLADISFGAGIISAAAGIWLVFTHEDARADSGTGARVRAAPRSGGGKVDVVLRF